MKRQRQRALLELLRQMPLSSQHEIQAELARLGHDATQSTISRDLEELGAVRVRDAESRLRYGLPTDAAAGLGTSRLRTLMAEFVVSIESSGSLVVVTTVPGAAAAVAEALDHAAVEGVLGSVAGDNTFLIVAREGVRGKVLAARLREMGGLS